MSQLQSIDANTLKEWLDRGEAIVIDVREPKENAEASIPGAHLIPLGTIDRNMLPPLHNKKLVLHCGIGKRSQMACEKLLLENPSLNVYNLTGGIKAWQAAGFTTISPGNAMLSLDRQWQILCGLGILIGVLLSFLIHPLFLLLPLLFGICLLYTGMTASPRIILLIARMPWNRLKS